MNALVSILINRLKRNPTAFGSPGAKDLVDIVFNKNKAMGVQWDGFGDKTNASKEVPSVIADRESLYKQANKDQKIRDFIQMAFQTALNGVARNVPDPFAAQGGTYGVRTNDKAPPGPNFTKVGTAGGQDFYTLKKDAKI